jgi:hypothetical protein
MDDGNDLSIVSAMLFHQTVIDASNTRFLEALDEDMQRKKQNIILLVDNAPSHVFDKDTLSNVRVRFLEPNMTSHIQPLDAGIIHAFKAYYRKLHVFCILDADAAGEEDIYRVNQLEGMRLANKAWGQVTRETVQNCWRHAGILPLSRPTVPGQPTAEVALANSELQSALNHLVALEVITRKNIALAADFVEVDEERVTEDMWTIEDLVNQHRLDVREAKGEHLEELEPEPAPEPKPLMSWKQASVALSDLARLFEVEIGTIPDTAHDVLPQMQRYARQQIEAAKKQTSITAFTFKLPTS